MALPLPFDIMLLILDVLEATACFGTMANLALADKALAPMAINRIYEYVKGMISGCCVYTINFFSSNTFSITMLSMKVSELSSKASKLAFLKRHHHSNRLLR